MHIGIILDGNRRYAKKYLGNPLKGHEKGAKTVEALLTWGQELGVKELSLFCFSTENFNRKKEEVDYLLDLFKKWFKKLKDDPSIMDNGVHIRFIGKKELFSEDLQSLMLEMEEKTKGHDAFYVNFCMGYGGRAEIVDAVKKIAKKVKEGSIAPHEITEETIKNNLYLSSEPDLIIRTSGEQRLSNFLTYQSTYAELYFLEKYWPEFTKDDLKDALKELNTRERRRGK